MFSTPKKQKEKENGNGNGMPRIRISYLTSKLNKILN